MAKNNDYPTIREMTIRNSEKIDGLEKLIKEINKKMDCVVKMKLDINRHETYFKFMGAAIGILVTLSGIVISKIL